MHRPRTRISTNGRRSLVAARGPHMAMSAGPPNDRVAHTYEARHVGWQKRWTLEPLRLGLAACDLRDSRALWTPERCAKAPVPHGIMERCAVHSLGLKQGWLPAGADAGLASGRRHDVALVEALVADSIVVLREHLHRLPLVGPLPGEERAQHRIDLVLDNS